MARSKRASKGGGKTRVRKSKLDATEGGLQQSNKTNAQQSDARPNDKFQPDVEAQVATVGTQRSVATKSRNKAENSDPPDYDFSCVPEYTASLSVAPIDHPYDLSKHLESKVDPAWFCVKEHGNCCLADGKIDEAIHAYTDAHRIATQGFNEYSWTLRFGEECMQYFVWALQAFYQYFVPHLTQHDVQDACSAGQRLLYHDDADDIFDRIRFHLEIDIPKVHTVTGLPGEVHTYVLPNKPAAICLANRSTAHLQARALNLPVHKPPPHV